MNLVEIYYTGNRISFNEDGWFNATEVAARFGKRPVDWLSLDGTKEYISTLSEVSNCEKSSLLKTRRGRHNSGTWFHPDLAVAFARWLDVRFSIWCDRQIKEILRGTHPHYDWKKMRSEATASFKVMNEALRIVRESQRKITAGYHYSNEARLVNYALAGKASSLDRESLSSSDLSLLAQLETRNAILVAQGFDYQTRKATLRVLAVEELGCANQKVVAIA